MLVRLIGIMLAATSVGVMAQQPIRTIDPNAAETFDASRVPKIVVGPRSTQAAARLEADARPRVDPVSESVPRSVVDPVPQARPDAVPQERVGDAFEPRSGAPLEERSAPDGIEPYGAPVPPGPQEGVPQEGAPAVVARPATPPRDVATTFGNDDLIAGAEGVFGKGAKGLAELIERIVGSRGRPTAYIAGREASGAFVVGLRYGSGTLTHKVEGPQPIYWTGPSVGFDVGGDATKVFVLVYDLADTEELFRRFPGGEGRLYAVGGFSASVLHRGGVTVVPIRLGVGWRAGVNAGYVKFTHRAKWLPF